jgi:hypothetical protein
MTANVKIPVASAENVTAVPLSAVFTEKAPENGQMERFVYVQQGDTFEKRNVKVGVSDYFYAEIQEGLKEGEIVSLELPKDELEKKSKQLVKQKKNGAEADAAGAKARPPASGTRTNRNRSTTGAAVTDTAPKTKSAGASASSPGTARSPS